MRGRREAPWYGGITTSLWTPATLIHGVSFSARHCADIAWKKDLVETHKNKLKEADFTPWRLSFDSRRTTDIFKQCFGFGSGFKWASRSGSRLGIRIQAGQNCSQKRGLRLLIKIKKNLGLDSDPDSATANTGSGFSKMPGSGESGSETMIFCI